MPFNLPAEHLSIKLYYWSNCNKYCFLCDDIQSAERTNHTAQVNFDKPQFRL